MAFPEFWATKQSFKGRGGNPPATLFKTGLKHQQNVLWENPQLAAAFLEVSF